MSWDASDTLEAGRAVKDIVPFLGGGSVRKGNENKPGPGLEIGGLLLVGWGLL